MSVKVSARPQDQSLAYRLRYWKERRIDWIGYLFLTPTILANVVFMIYPIIFSIVISFYRWDGLGKPLPVGWGNFWAVYTDPEFRNALKNTMVYTLGTVPVTMALSLMVAVLLNQKVQGRGIFRTVFYLPNMASGIATIIIWLWMFDYHNGILNYLVGLFGLERQYWLGRPATAMFSILLKTWWGSLAGFLIFLAGLQGIPSVLYEAAEIDGANGWSKFRYVTLPLLAPTTFYVFVTRMIGAFQVFGDVYVMTGGGPNGATDVVIHYIFFHAFHRFELGYSSAVSWMLGILIMIATLIQWKYVRRDIEY
jgi:multiple sugar transport system permease protein